MNLTDMKNSDIRALIDEFTTSEKLRFQLRERLINGRTYAEMDLVGDRLKEREYVIFKKKCESFFRFVQKKVG